MPRLARVVALALAVLGLPGRASATNVLLNGQTVDSQGLANQKLEKVTISFDANGGIRIDAPGYAVQTVGSTPAPPPAPAKLSESTPVAMVAAPSVITKHYFLVTEQPAAGMTGYDIDVYINSKWIKKLKGTEEQIVMDITKNLLPGQNKILFSAKKTTGERKSFSPNHTFTVTIGEGAQGGDQVMIDNPLLSFKRSAADTDDVSEEYSLLAR